MDNVHLSFYEAVRDKAITLLVFPPCKTLREARFLAIRWDIERLAIFAMEQPVYL